MSTISEAIKHPRYTIEVPEAKGRFNFSIDDNLPDDKIIVYQGIYSRDRTVSSFLNECLFPSTFSSKFAANTDTFHVLIKAMEDANLNAFYYPEPELPSFSDSIAIAAQLLGTKTFL